MADFPNTRHDLEAAGYRYSGESNCRGCGEPMLWFDTPRGKKLPMSVVAGTENREHRILEPHWKVCPEADNFRKEKK